MRGGRGTWRAVRSGGRAEPGPRREALRARGARAGAGRGPACGEGPAASVSAPAPGPGHGAAPPGPAGARGRGRRADVGAPPPARAAGTRRAGGVWHSGVRNRGVVRGTARSLEPGSAQAAHPRRLPPRPGRGPARLRGGNPDPPGAPSPPPPRLGTPRGTDVLGSLTFGMLQMPKLKGIPPGRAGRGEARGAGTAAWTRGSCGGGS